MTSTTTLPLYSVKAQNNIPTTLVVIDSAVKDYQLLLEGIEPAAEVIILDEQQNGIEQITALLSQQSIYSLQLIAHGSSGSLQLGNTSVNLDNLHSYQQQLQQWQVTDILIYGCEVAAKETGKAFLNQLHQLTSANIAASEQKIGHAKLGGSWELKVKIGQISSHLALQPEVKENYPCVLGSGPGGVGTTDGLSNLELWLKANTGLTTNAGQVTTWNDQSGNNANATQSTSTKQPIVVNNAINGQATVQFDGVDDNLTIPLNINPSSLPNISVFIVFKSDTQNSTPLRKLYGHDNGGYDRSIGLDFRATTNFTYFAGPTYAVQNYFPLAANTFYLSSHTYTPTSFTGWIDGSLKVAAGTVNTQNGFSSLSVGSVSPSFGEYWDGDIAEFIIFDTLLNSAERQIIDNYLGAKYNINLANDLYIGDNAGTDYDLDIGGIGKESDGNNTSANSQGLNISDSTFLQDDGDYLLFGHNQTAANTTVNSDLPAGISDRWSRVWFLDKTDSNNNDGTLNLSFDFGDSGLAGTPVGNYSLLYRSNTTGNFSVVSGLTSIINGDQVTFNGVNTVVLNDGFYTLGKVNTTPTLAIPIADQSTTTGSAFDFSFAANTFNDVDAGDTLTYIATLENGDNLPSWLTFNADTRTFSGIPPTAGNLSIRVTAKDLANAFVDDVFAVVINSTPTLAIPIADQSATTGSAFDFSFAANTFNDVDAGDTLTYIATLENGDNLPSWLTFNANTRTFSGTPPATGNLSIKVTARDSANASVDDVFALGLNSIIQSTQLINNAQNDIFKISTNKANARLQVTLTGRNSQLVNELVAFIVDDDNGTINGIAPSAAGYAQAAIARSAVVFSAIANIPNGFSTNNLTRSLEFNANENVRFALVKNNTFDAIKFGSANSSDIIFSSSSSQKINALGDNVFSIGWQDGSNINTSEFNDLVVNVQATDNPLPLGTNLQDEFEGEVIDLTGINDSVSATFTVNREAAFDSFIGFYRVTDADGGIDTNSDGVADFLPRQAGYLQAAINQRVVDINLTVNNQGTATYTSTLSNGAIFAPFIIVNGRPETLLDTSSSNDPVVYFPYLGANSDKADHIRLLGDNIFGFEDLPNLGDKDYNDMILTYSHGF